MIKRLNIYNGNPYKGDPLADQNISDVMQLVNKIRLSFGQEKKIWLYTGYTWEEIYNGISLEEYDNYRWITVSQVDYLVEGRFIDELKDLSLQFRGSSNQRIIDVQQTLQKGIITLWQN
ncbi:MAG: 4Fe-4S cluster-binding domain-containing protein [Bacilli bacterium]|nr:4Fe-4S cluster-binding domain-containing protein [Bacilli bacterium]